MCVLTHENQVVMQMTSQFLSFPSWNTLFLPCQPQLVHMKSRNEHGYGFRPGGMFMHLNTHHTSIEQPASKVSTCPSKESSHWASRRVRRPSSSRPPENRASHHASLCFNAIIGSLLCQYIHEVKHLVSFMQFGRLWTKNTHRGLS